MSHTMPALPHLQPHGSLSEYFPFSRVALNRPELLAVVFKQWPRPDFKLPEPGTHFDPKPKKTKKLEQFLKREYVKKMTKLYNYRLKT